MTFYFIAKKKITILFFVLLFVGITGYTQTFQQPVWWFGVSGAANFNFYRGTTQMLNSNLTVPTAFHKGDGVMPYISLLTEYRPNKIWGGMLNIAYDNRGGNFDGVEAPCNCAATLSSNISYITIEPSLRLSPFASSFYIFAGPTLSFNVANSFTYTQQLQPDTKGNWSDIRSTVFSAQAGAGIDIPMSAKTSAEQMTLSPFISFLTDFGHEPRSTESWSFYTIRAGVALKFGRAKQSNLPAASNQPITTASVVTTTTVVVPISYPQNTGICLSQRETFIPDSVVVKVCDKYGPDVYDITKITGDNLQDEYVVRTINDGIVKTIWVNF